ncbi:MAG: 4-hydroxy-3-methylbut-2-en-1-yl diphosphate synthase [Ignavibacteria bacterium RIFOXYB2_FULL_35_12]|nr:MAG: 4-hydroxy-3-methylbut-2-en-1-yl diphosphate synthase [Ignavibacteria bacterium GWA2_36_19]OGU54701.1 MAG: 4-hydroxy-3-methylbut-2-en-1-yl diphosphate synthase [Ignavibacteria bacterium GWC2_35_8]OGU60769.1 MAG: 4-hydroxy-3-methylbut-2-en-1-yl diphosphate synthase [Ignavibacteria bacterium GWF2_35_20]OGU78266.1 MAG: 4-hydroxy-3-methylbut-2-en-1-yl diphosphate synthase [Ignavibacteria bacterium RIFOXYA2_FULL_35_9]OGU84192.1 MAG: 4-hydroxy-3-methylbut-2-en-1-yl diphosphate synthase [Ignavi
MTENITHSKKYCNSLTKYSRYKTREVFIGDIPLGANNPIRIQSMTTTNTMDTKATVEQTIRMVNAGCEYVRITAPSKSEAENLANIKKELRARGYSVPLIADIHFTPNAAEISARIVEKVRINPGNYVDKKKFETIEYSDEAYYAEIDRIRERFSPLVKICKEYGTAMRIGTNHGSLSDRIMSRYGDTPLGMVESALEFVRICEELNYYNIVLSMKASNPQVMIQAYRLLITKMQDEGMNYPLHLGVTEAGGGEDGRIKSALGIGSLLEDGIGDTIRVSLTEDPEFEAPIAISLANRYKSRIPHKEIEEVNRIPFDPLNYSRRRTFEALGIGGSNVPRVFADYSKRKIKSPKDLSDVGYSYDQVSDKWNMTDLAADLIYLGNQNSPFDIPIGMKAVYDYEHWLKLEDKNKSFPLMSVEDYLSDNQKSDTLSFIQLDIELLNQALMVKIKNDKKVIIVLVTSNLHGMAEQRRVFMKLLENDVKKPVIIKRSYENLNLDELRLYSSTDVGALLIDGFGDGVWLQANDFWEKADQNDIYVKNLIRKKESNESLINRTLFGILQAARVRISKTEYIACPSCGRTLFDLQETTEMIRKRTEHLKGVKIAIMGCIVNGPGEMADADYGYVGSGIDKITLYRGKDIVQRNINAEFAVDSLIDIIKGDENWVEPE